MNNPQPSSIYDAMSKDELLLKHQNMKDTIKSLQADEMELRKYIVAKAFPDATEGTNTQELGSGYKLKAVVKYTYSLADNDVVEKGLEKIGSLGNEGKFIADRLVNWHPTFALKEYRELQDDAAKGSKFANDCLEVIHGFLTVKEASPTLEIIEPKAKK